MDHLQKKIYDLIESLEYAIKQDSFNLNPVDQESIVRKIEELRNFINERYRTHQ